MDGVKCCARMPRSSENIPMARQFLIFMFSLLGELYFPITKIPNCRFDRLADAPLDENGTIQKKYDIIQLDGLAGVGERVDPGDVYVNKQTPTNANDNTFTGQAATVPYKNTPMSYKSPVAGYIDKVMISDTENDQTLIKVLIRQTRRPELGDKFSSRHGQKGVCGLIVNQEDMPFNDQGISPGKSMDYWGHTGGLTLLVEIRS